MKLILYHTKEIHYYLMIKQFKVSKTPQINNHNIGLNHKLNRMNSLNNNLKKLIEVLIAVFMFQKIKSLRRKRESLLN